MNADATETSDNTFTKQLRCKLTDAERLQKGQAFNSVLDELDELDAELADIKDSYKRRAKGIKERGAALRKDFATGEEDRPVKCIQEPDFRRNIMLVRRLDTHEVIEERALESHELQGELELDAKPADDDEVAKDDPPPPPKSGKGRRRRKPKPKTDGEGASP